MRRIRSRLRLKCRVTWRKWKEEQQPDHYDFVCMKKISSFLTQGSNFSEEGVWTV